MSCVYLWPHASGAYGQIVIVVVTIISMLTSIPGNILTGWVIIKTEVLRSEPAYLLIFSVCLADAMVSSVTQPLFIATMLLGTRTSCCLDNIYFSFAWLSSVASTLSVVAITIDRYLFIVYPMYYQDYMTQKRAVTLIIFIWISAIAFAVLPLVHHNSLLLQSSVLCIMVLMSIIMVYTYGRVFRTLRRIVPVQSCGPQERPTKGRNQATRTVMLVLLSFMGCWIPWVIISFIAALHENVHSMAPLKVSSLFMKFYWIFLMIGYCNSSMNVFIYSRKNTVLQRAVKKYFRKIHAYVESKMGIGHTNIQRNISIFTTNNNTNIEPNKKTICIENI